ncbi:MAG: hypothetical protein IH901_04425, partial [Proteobacteria bacterium]|nr:hypothetical protein [Pseudomonadota bacterium]
MHRLGGEDVAVEDVRGVRGVGVVVLKPGDQLQGEPPMAAGARPFDPGADGHPHQRLDLALQLLPGPLQILG